MPGINKVLLLGHVGKDPELATLTDNVPVLRFSLATSETITKKGGYSKQTEWHNIVMWRGLALSASRQLKQGKLVYIEGKIRTSPFIDNDGNKKYATEIFAEHFKLLGRSSDFAGEHDETIIFDPETL